MAYRPIGDKIIFSTLKPQKDGGYFADYIFRFIFIKITGFWICKHWTDDGLAHRAAITWTNDDFIYWHIHASLGLLSGAKCDPKFVKHYKFPRLYIKQLAV